jgi:hypothetical protein
MSVLRNLVEQAARAKKIVVDSFTYTATWLPLAGNAVTPITIPISADSDFLWMETCLTAFTAINVLDPNPDLLMAFTDTGSGRNLQDNPVHINNIIGNGQWPYVLPEPKLLIGAGGLQVTLTNNTAVAKARVDLAIIGIKIFYISSYNRSDMIQGI